MPPGYVPLAVNECTVIVWVPDPTAETAFAVRTWVVDPDPMVMESPTATGLVSPVTLMVVPLVKALASVVTGVTVTGTLIRLAVSAGGLLACSP